MVKVLVTGSSGHLGEALVRTIQLQKEYEVVSLDRLPADFTSVVGSIEDRSLVSTLMKDVKIVFHAATLHKPHVATHSNQDFVNVNITGTLNLLEEAASNGVEAFIFTSTTSVFGDALIPPTGSQAAWITEETVPIPKNIYGVTKFAAENLCQLFSRNCGLNCVILRTSRFFPEEDDDDKAKNEYSDDNLKAVELLYRRVDIQDVVDAHLSAAYNAKRLRFAKFIISATTPFQQEDMEKLRVNASDVLKGYFPQYLDLFSRNSWKMLPYLDRVYVNDLARKELQWSPKFDFNTVLDAIENQRSFQSEMTKIVGSKGYHRR